MNRSQRRSHSQTGAALVEYAIASLIFVTTMLWIGFALESVAVSARQTSLKAVTGAERRDDGWHPVGMVPCGGIISAVDCY